MQWTKSRWSKKRSLRVVKRVRALPSFEAVERRELLASGFLQGIAFHDANGNGLLDATDPRVANATIQRQALDAGGNPIGAITTQATAADGSYLFTGLASGKYRLTETAAPGYVGSATQAMSQVLPVTATTTNSIDVQVVDPDSTPPLQLTYAARPSNKVPMDYVLDGTLYEAYVGGFIARVSGGGLAAPTTYFNSFCLDIPNPTDTGQTYPVRPRPIDLALLPNGGRIAYLFNHHPATPNLNSSGSPTRTLSGLTANEAAALQLAIWELEYDAAVDGLTGTYTAALFTQGSPSAGRFYVSDTFTYNPAILTRAADYLNESVGKNERAIFLDGSPFTPSFQGMIATGSFNFANRAVASIGDLVWEDQDGDGQQDAGEPGIDGVAVELLNAGGTVVGTTTTAGGGLYAFTGLMPGTYSVRFVKPSGYAFTAQDVGGNTTDSDANPTTGRTGPYTLAGTENNITVDAGLYKPASLGDLVWEDENANGQQDPGEPGVDGVAVALLDAGGAVIGSTTTAGGGLYSFSDLALGAYSVRFTAPDGYTSTPADLGPDASDSDASPNTGETGSYTLASGDNNTTVDAGLYRPAALGNLVWQDGNANGQQDPGEQGVDGVAVELLNAGGAVIGATTTVGGGLYSFTGLTPGTYSVRFTAPDGYTSTPADLTSDVTDSDASPNTGETGSYTLISGDNNTTVDAGLYLPVSVGNFVWEDSDGDGVQDAGEPGLGGVALTLTGTTGSGAPITRTTTTDGDGGYLFSDLAPGSYSVGVATPAGYAPTATGQGSPAADSNPTPAATTPATLPSGGSDRTLDFGFYRPAALGDLVWEDKDGDGVRDAGEPGLGGVAVTLTGTDGAGRPVAATTSTDAGGLYRFTDLAPGIYRVQFAAPAGSTFTGQDRGADDATDSDADPGTGRTGSYTLASGDNNITVDAGLYRPAALGDFVWEDKNGNGIQDVGEPGIAGAAVKLLDAANNQVGATYTTLANGYYQFTGLAPGTYTVTISPPAGFSPTTSNATGSTTANDSNGSPTSATLASDGSDQTLDFGYYKPAALGDFVWHDLNANGIQDGGEQGIEGVTVTLYDANGNLVATQVTPNSGAYLFTELTPGTYSVLFAEPGEYVFTTQNAGTNDATDSDANTSTGKTGPITLVSGQTDRTIDAGFKAPSASLLEQLGNEGGTPGFWKNNADKQGSVAWGPTGLLQSQNVSTLFTIPMGLPPSVGNQNLLQALSNGGGGVNALLRQAVAAVLNARHPLVHYAVTSTQIIASVNAALNSGNAVTIEALKNQLDAYNNLFHPLDQKGRRI